ncbi:MAG TPA: phytanoyl-CoA dioxygenase family protein [Sphingopyxis sp.]|jgi:ectoine hydroxylase-related dioxygenase (phytanoyl-CoA dioxygenase family)|nr:phytanoyl-CoA dioxygenase family protein [Sphingopyxis sp.]
MTFIFSNPPDETGVDDIAAALRTYGLVIVNDVLDSDTVAKLMGAIEPEFGSEMSGTRDAVPETRPTVQAVPGLLGIDPVYADTLLLNPMFLAVADRILGPHCHNYRVQVSTGMRIVPGGDNQFLHREMDIYRPFLPYDTSQAELILFAMWAGTDFTPENGATMMVPGSHLWEEGRKAEDGEVVRAVMPKGSVAMWLGTTLHAGASNRTEQPRTGFICALGVDWLTPEENQLLTIPPEAARNLPEKAQRLIGYQAAPMYGWVRGMKSDNLLEIDRSVTGYINAGLNEA